MKLTNDQVRAIELMRNQLITVLDEDLEGKLQSIDLRSVMTQIALQANSLKMQAQMESEGPEDLPQPDKPCVECGAPSDGNCPVQLCFSCWSKEDTCLE